MPCWPNRGSLQPDLATQCGCDEQHKSRKRNAGRVRCAKLAGNMTEHVKAGAVGGPLQDVQALPETPHTSPPPWHSKPTKERLPRCPKHAFVPQQAQTDRG